MENNSNPPNAAALAQKVATLQQQYRNLIRPDQIMGIPNLPAAEKPKYVEGIKNFWDELARTPASEPRYKEILNKLSSFTQRVVQAQKQSTANAQATQAAQSGQQAQQQQSQQQPQQPPQQQQQQQQQQTQPQSAQQAQPQKQGQPQSQQQASQQEYQKRVEQAVQQEAQNRTFYPPPGHDDAQAEKFKVEARNRWIQNKIQFEIHKNQFTKISQAIAQIKEQKKEVPEDWQKRLTFARNEASKAKKFLDDFEKMQEANKPKGEAAAKSEASGQQPSQQGPAGSQQGAQTPQSANAGQQQYSQAQLEQMRRQQQMHLQQQQQQQKMQNIQQQPQAQPATPAVANASVAGAAQRPNGAGDGTPTQQQPNAAHPGQPPNMAQRNSISQPGTVPQQGQQTQAAPGPPAPTQPFTNPTTAIAQAAAVRAHSQQGQPAQQPATQQAQQQQAQQQAQQQQQVPTPQSATSQTGPGGAQTMQRPDTDRKFPITKNPNFPSPSPVSTAQARPTLVGGSSGPVGVMGQPAIAKHPSFTLQGTGDHVLDKKKLDELVRQVMGPSADEQGLRPEVEESILMLADEFVDNVIISACRLAKLRDSNSLELRDIQLILERQYNIRIPGHSVDELRTVKKTQPSASYLQKMNAVQAAKVMGGKAEL